MLFPIIKGLRSFYFSNLIILYSTTPPSDLTFTISDFLDHRSAFQTKDSLDILGVSAKISTSVVPTILKISFSLFSRFSIVTTVHIATLSFEDLSSEITSIFFKFVSISIILFSSAACSFLASSYSEFSDKSQNEIASFNFSAISTLFTSFKFFNSDSSLTKPSLVIKILSAIIFYIN